MAIDTFGDYLDFHSHLHALLAHGLFCGLGCLPQPSGGSFFGLCDAPRNPKKPVFDFLVHFLSLCVHGNARFRLQTPGQRPGGPKAISYQFEDSAPTR
jgi:hypothetical protein